MTDLYRRFFTNHDSCPACSGFGWFLGPDDTWEERRTCTDCGGQGLVEIPLLHAPDQDTFKTEAP